MIKSLDSSSSKFQCATLLKLGTHYDLRFDLRCARSQLVSLRFTLQSSFHSIYTRYNSTNVFQFTSFLNLGSHYQLSSLKSEREKIGRLEGWHICQFRSLG